MELLRPPTIGDGPDGTGGGEKTCCWKLCCGEMLTVYGCVCPIVGYAVGCGIPTGGGIVVPGYGMLPVIMGGAVESGFDTYTFGCDLVWLGVEYVMLPIRGGETVDL